MKKVFNILIPITASILTIGLVLGLPAYFLLLHHYKGKKVVKPIEVEQYAKNKDNKPNV